MGNGSGGSYEDHGGYVTAANRKMNGIQEAGQMKEISMDFSEMK